MMITRENGDGKYLILAGNRRYEAMKSDGCEDAPILVTDMPDNMVKHVALIENYMRLNMCREDIANTLVDIYLDEGLIESTKNEDVKKIHSELNRMLHTNQPASQARIDPKIASMSGMLGMSRSNQRDYLTEYLHLDEKTKAIIRKHRINKHKAMTLTDRKIRHDPELQNAMAEKMKDLTTSEAQDFAKKVKNGEVKKEDVPEYKPPTKPPKKKEKSSCEDSDKSKDQTKDSGFG